MSILAKDITDCSECPLNGHDCTGYKCYGGALIEPPCCSWNGDEEIYKGMHDNAQYCEPSESDKEYFRRKEQEDKEQKEREHKADLENQIRRYSKYGNAKIKDGGGLTELWYCPHCHNWTTDAGWSYKRGDVYVFDCRICHTTLAHSYELDRF